MEILHGSSNWMEEFKSMLPFLGHRNWILIVDKAFPAQSTAGIKYIDTRQELLPTLRDVLKEISNNAPHLSPIIYTDMELKYMTDSLSPGVQDLRKNIYSALEDFHVNTLLHEDVFKKLDEAASMFEVLVLKTDTLKPYTSLFIELDCGYWSSDKEEKLRENMKLG